MTLLRPSLFSPFLIFFCFLLLATLCRGASNAMSKIGRLVYCSDPGNYTSPAYEANLKQFLATLEENTVSKNGGFFNGTIGDGADTVYGLAMCSAACSRDDCGDCLAAATASNTDGLLVSCPGSATVFSLFDMCLVQYSDTNFFGTAQTDLRYSSLMSGLEPSSAATAYGRKIEDRLLLLTDEAVKSPQRFAASAADDPPYALMQCTWDLPPNKCKQCLDALSANASYSFSMAAEGEHKSFSCALRYSNTSFTVVPFNDTSLSPGPLPPKSAPTVKRATTSAPPSRARGSRTSTALIGSASALGGTSLFIGFIWCVCRLRRKHNTTEEGVNPRGQIQSTSIATTGQQNQATATPSSTVTTTVNENGQGSDPKEYVPRSFTYEQLVTATRDFDEQKKLGHGAFGDVYEGILPVPGIDMTVAIKVIKETLSNEAKKAFCNEIKIVRRLHHRNILRLLGWCKEDEHLLLVYEIMENGNLEDHLYPKNGNTDALVYNVSGAHASSRLSWPMRRNILIGIASGLQYLHTECPDDAILHGDIKPANVMLSKAFNAKLADFGLVMQLSHTKTSRPAEVVIGSQAYIDPAYVETGKACGQGDVYSLGVTLLEIVCGEKPRILGGQNTLIEKVRKCLQENKILEAADKGIRGQSFDKAIEAALRIGLKCVQSDIRMRPHAGRVREFLMQLDDGPPLHRVSENGSAAASSSRNRQASEEEQFRTCPTMFHVHSQADEESDAAAFLPSKNKLKMPAS